MMSKAVGIIAEYNPFHNGHAYQIQQAKELSGADYCVVAMSGDYVQRGAPAIYDKYARARMALSSGADLVLEIPTPFAVSSAEDFASCGVALLDRLGVVDFLCFGSECGDIDTLMKLAKILCEEPEEYREVLAARLRQGLTFPQARAEALGKYMDVMGRDYALAELFVSPNNILGIEYCKAILKREQNGNLHSPMRPVTIKRAGSGYHDVNMPSDNSFPSATAIRDMLKGDDAQVRSNFNHLSQSVPRAVLSLMQNSVPVFTDDFSVLLSQRLLQLQISQTPFTDFADVSKELASRINRRVLDFAPFEDRIASLKPRQYTYTRISRALLHILLDITEQEIADRKSRDHVSYIRVLGFRRESAPLLSSIKKATTLPIITKTADAASILDARALHDFRRDLYDSHLYQSVLAQKSGKKISNEYTASIVIL